MIRAAAATDRDAVIRLLEASRAGAGFDRADGPTGFVFPFDPAYAARLFDLHRSADKACCLVLDVEGVARGVLMATAYEHPFGPVWIAKETVWWIDPAHRRGFAAVRMLDAYEAWARDRGCAFVGMAGMGDDPNVANLYRRRGYGAAEVHFLKAL